MGVLLVKANGSVYLKQGADEYPVENIVVGPTYEGGSATTNRAKIGIVAEGNIVPGTSIGS